MRNILPQGSHFYKDNLEKGKRESEIGEKFGKMAEMSLSQFEKNGVSEAGRIGGSGFEGSDGARGRVWLGNLGSGKAVDPKKGQNGENQEIEITDGEDQELKASKKLVVAGDANEQKTPQNLLKNGEKNHKNPKSQKDQKNQKLSETEPTETTSTKSTLKHTNNTTSNNQSTPTTLKGRQKVKDYMWLYYDENEDKEIDYLEDFLYLNKGLKISKNRLGLWQEKLKNKKNSSGKEDFVDPILGKRALPQALNSSSKKVMDVANNIMERLIKFGRLSSDHNTIKRKQHNHRDFYEQDEFIDDPEDLTFTNNMEQFESKFGDFFVVSGGIDKFKKSERYLRRLEEMSQHNRNNKTKELAQMKKQMRKRRDKNDLKMIANSDIESLRKKLKEKELKKLKAGENV